MTPLQNGFLRLAGLPMLSHWGISSKVQVYRKYSTVN